MTRCHTIHGPDERVATAISVVSLPQTGADPDPDAMAIARSVASHWPGEPAAAMSAGLETNDRSAGVPSDAPMLVFLPGGRMTPDVRCFLDRLDTSQAPAVLVWDGDNANREHAAMIGLVSFRPTDDPETIARGLHAVWVRQSIVERLSEEARLDRHHRRRMSAELDEVHDELQLASRLQRDLMPSELPKRDDLEFGLIFRPATYLSGDIYDVAVLPDGRIAFLLADAVGHGVSAAMLTVAVTRSLWRADEAFGTDRASLTPDAALARLNHDMCSRWRCERWFITAVCGVFDPTDASVTLASAGHPLPVLARPDGGWDKVDVGGPLLGVFEEAEYESARLTLAPGEVLTVYSDGFEVALPGTDRAADEHALRSPTAAYLDAIGLLARDADREGEGVQAALDRLVMRLDQQAGSLHRPDDVTALSLRRPG